MLDCIIIVNWNGSQQLAQSIQHRTYGRFDFMSTDFNKVRFDAFCCPVSPGERGIVHISHKSIVYIYSLFIAVDGVHTI